MVNHPISDFLIRIKNAGMAGKGFVSIPFSNINFSIANLLKEKGFLGEVRKKGKKNIKIMEVDLIYEDGKPRISDVEPVSKPSRRQYSGAKDIKMYKQGFGMTVLSTPRGILADTDAKKENVGGEILFKIW